MRKVNELQDIIHQRDQELRQQKAYYGGIISGLEKKNKDLDSRIEGLEHENLQIQAVHVKSFNVVNPGVEPISDQTIVSRLVDIHDRVSQFCRTAFKGRKLLSIDSSSLCNFKLQGRLEGGVSAFQKYRFSLANTMEMVFWTQMEKLYSCFWLPGLEGDINNALLRIQSMVLNGTVCSFSSYASKC